MSETAKHRELTVPYCQGNGLDLGSGGDPVVPSAIQVDLPEGPQYGAADTPVQWRGDARDLSWIADDTMDYVYSSHLIEDFHEWGAILREWQRVVKPGGHVVILVPDKDRYPGGNANHVHEGMSGEISTYFSSNWRVLSDASTGDYSVLFIARRDTAPESQPKPFDYRGRTTRHRCFGLVVLNHPEFGWYWSPNQCSWTVENAGTADNKLYTINEVGSRGGMVAWQAPKLLLLGCSNAFGHGLHDHECLGAQLQSRLGYQVINAGMPGFSTLNAIRYSDYWMARLPNIRAAVLVMPRCDRTPSRRVGGKTEVDTSSVTPTNPNEIPSEDYQEFLESAANAERSLVSAWVSRCLERAILPVLSSYYLYKDLRPQEIFDGRAVHVWDEILEVCDANPEKVQISPQDHHPSLWYAQTSGALLAAAVVEAQPSAERSA